MTLPVINAAKEVIYLVSGDRKADALNAVINGPHQPRDYPAQSVQPENLFWYVDQAAARLL
jgi:6-phosphogluconolactonase